jgi:hypothetical protein
MASLVYLGKSKTIDCKDGWIHPSKGAVDDRGVFKDERAFYIDKPPALWGTDTATAPGTPLIPIPLSGCIQYFAPKWRRFGYRENFSNGIVRIGIKQAKVRGRQRPVGSIRIKLTVYRGGYYWTYETGSSGDLYNLWLVVWRERDRDPDKAKANAGIAWRMSTNAVIGAVDRMTLLSTHERAAIEAEAARKKAAETEDDVADAVLGGDGFAGILLPSAVGIGAAWIARRQGWFR